MVAGIRKKLKEVAELLDREIRLAETLLSALEGAPMSIHTKTIRGKKYVYASYREGKKVMTRYLGAVEPKKQGTLECSSLALALKSKSEEEKQREAEKLRRYLQELMKLRRNFEEAYRFFCLPIERPDIMEGSVQQKP